MNIVLSKESLEDNFNISIEEFICLISIGENLNTRLEIRILSSLEKKGFIKILNGTAELREAGIQLIDSYRIDGFDIKKKKIVKTKIVSNRKVTEDIKDNLSEYRSVFKGIKAGAMGDPKSCEDKLSRWLLSNPNYGMKDVIKAAKFYVSSVDNIKYLRRADYFIYKKEGTGEESSTLSAIIEELPDVDVKTDWLNTFT